MYTHLVTLVQFGLSMTQSEVSTLQQQMSLDQFAFAAASTGGITTGSTSEHTKHTMMMLYLTVQASNFGTQMRLAT